MAICGVTPAAWCAVFTGKPSVLLPILADKQLALIVLSCCGQHGACEQAVLEIRPLQCGPVNRCEETRVWGGSELQVTVHRLEPNSRVILNPELFSGGENVPVHHGHGGNS